MLISSAIFYFFDYTKEVLHVPDGPYLLCTGLGTDLISSFLSKRLFSPFKPVFLWLAGFNERPLQYTWLTLTLFIQKKTLTEVFHVLLIEVFVGVSLLVASQLVLMKFTLNSRASFVTPTGERQENKFIANQWNMLKGQIVSLTCVPSSAFSQGCCIQKSSL